VAVVVLTVRHGQIAKDVDHCDSDKIKMIKHLNKIKGKVHDCAPALVARHSCGTAFARGVL
jgi:hypothetical protein